MTDTVQEVRYAMPDGRTVTRIEDPDEVEITDTWTRITKDDHVVRLNAAVPVIIETHGAGEER